MLKTRGKENAFARQGARGQTAIEYLLLIAGTIAFVTVIAYFIKTKVIAP